MPLLTIVEEYIHAALRHAVREELEDGTIGATIPEFPGLVAYGSDVHECAREMSRLVEETVKGALSQGRKLPVLDGLDLNSTAAQILATYRDLSPIRDRGSTYHDEHDLDQAFKQRGEPSA